MSSRKPPYHETLLHWIWEHKYFNYRQLKTNEGKQIQIHSTGKANKSDGPDFTGAKLTIGSLRWYGDVEIHWNSSDWQKHGHHKDENFNNVVLHVVFQETDHQCRRQDHTTVPTCILSDFLTEPLHAFLERYRRRSELPCAGQLSFISEEAFTKQLEKAHKEYFEQKVDDLLEFYDPSLPPSKAWVKMFVTALFDGLGISHNRRPMQQLAYELHDKLPDISSRDELRTKALQISGMRSNDCSSSKFIWKHKGCRPGNHPQLRIQQGAEALWYIYNLPFEQWMQEKPSILWKNLISSIAVTPSIGCERSSILFGTVFLPALYSLGNLFYSEKLKSRCWDLWRNHRASIPKSLVKKLAQTDIPPSVYAKKLGAVYQLREYCRPRNCQDCKVFKSAISS